MPSTCPKKASSVAAALASAFAGRDAETDASFEDRDRKIDRIEADVTAMEADLAALRDGAATGGDPNIVEVDSATMRGTSPS